MDSSPYSSGMPYYGDSASSGTAASGRHHPYPQHQQQPQSAYHSSLPNLGSAQQYEQTTLPPLQSQSRPPAGTSSSLFDHYNRPHQQQPGFPGAAGSQLSSYGGPGAPFAGQFANYSHESLLPQQHQAYPMQHDPANGGYMGDLRNSTFGGLGSSLPPPLPSSQAYGPPFAGAYDSSPPHVVGAQGRRGILPSDDGRPIAIPADGTASSRSSVMPVKDADGKYPCPHCNKSYLHAKHLKRHLLRHTGDRPYSCFLCNDTFSRSDILKRHFQKCSIRRGNPTGASHLQNSQSHLRKQAAKRSSNDLGKADTKSLPDSETTSITSASTSRPASDNFSSIRSDGRTDSGISTKSSIISRDARSMTGPQPLTPVKPEQGPYGQQQQASVNTALPSTSGRDVTYTHGSTGTHGYQPPELHQPDPHHTKGDFDWAGTQQPQQQQQQQPPIPTTQHGGVDFSHPYYAIEPGATTAHDYDQQQHHHHPHHHHQQQQQHHQSSPWQMPYQTPSASFHQVSQRLISFLQINDLPEPESSTLRSILTPDNIEHFLEMYQNFHVHWPHVHLKTFNPLTSYAGLALAMVNIGAVYSDRVDFAQVRALMARTKLHVRQFSEVGKAASDPSYDIGSLVDNEEAYDQIVSLSLLTTLILWHADPEQRVMLNGDHPSLCSLLRRMDMLKPLSRSYPSYSELHQPDLADSASFDYGAWLRQEKRSRAFYLTLLTDMGQFLYFNTQPNFTAEEVELPLPSDDAAWEAANGDECAVALGLHGPDAQQACNASGSQRVKQLEFNKAMAKLSASDSFESRSTNAFGRFILVHGIHIRIWFAQHLRSASGDFLNPLAPADGQVGEPQSRLLHLDTELANWRSMSDQEDALQYPPDAPPRLGFCRDGKTYYWLGKMLIKNTAFLDPNAHWQHRFRTMVQALKQAKDISANETRAENGLLTLTTDNVDPLYGIDDLTLDMKLLFTPLTPQGSPGVSEGPYQQLSPAERIIV